MTAVTDKPLRQRLPNKPVRRRKNWRRAIHVDGCKCRFRSPERWDPKLERYVVDVEVVRPRRWRRHSRRDNRNVNKRVGTGIVRTVVRAKGTPRYRWWGRRETMIRLGRRTA